MSSSFEQYLAAYDYAMPPDLIARAPASPRDSAALAVLHQSSGVTTWTTVREIGRFLPPRSLLVLNRTKVIPARLIVIRPTGGMVQLLILGIADDCVRAWSNRRLKQGERLDLAAGQTLTVMGNADREWLLRPSFPLTDLPGVLNEIGRTPLPPYIKETPLSEQELRLTYQSVFARDPGSIAAPTASLHFTEALLGELRASGIETADVTLHVHIGTFAPLTEEQWRMGQLHAEEYRIAPGDRERIEGARKEGRRIIAVGTTVARALESAADKHGHIVRPEGTTTLFMQEGYDFKMINGLITNFHVPRSSLLMLVCALAGHKRVLGLYREAIGRKMRFFSFGDAMMIV